MSKTDEEDILWDVAKNCISKLGFVDCVVSIFDPSSATLEQKAAYGPKNPTGRTLYKPMIVALGQGITGHVAESGIAEIVNDTSLDNRYIVDDEPRLSKICVPITIEEDMYGVIDCEHPDKNFFNEQHLKMLSVIASICAIKLKSVRDHRELTEKQEKLIRIREEMVDLRLKVLNSQLHPHFVFNALNAIQHFIYRENKRLALDYLSTFSKLIRFYLNQLDKDTVALEDELDMLNWYLKLQRLRYEGVFNYSIQIENGKEFLNDAVIPSFVIQSLLDNIVESSVYYTKNRQQLTVKFNLSSSTINITIQDQKCDGSSEEKFKKDVEPWQEQVEILNSVKKYNIDKELSFVKEPDSCIRKISLQLPNLN
ncbi:histidine kinase [Flagellimonas sp. GZD32]|uniref:histidine kinase n=1 Tax=Flagellimonas cixiensis TaxID=3228750 RepID=UPI0035C92868